MNYSSNIPVLVIFDNNVISIVLQLHLSENSKYPVHLIHVMQNILFYNKQIIFPRNKTNFSKMCEPERNERSPLFNETILIV